MSSTTQAMGSIVTATHAMAVGGLVGMFGAATAEGVASALLQGLGLVLLLGGLVVVRQTARGQRRTAETA